MFSIAFTLACLGLLAFGVYRVVIRYRAATGTTWERVLATGKGSASIVWSYAVWAGGLVVSAATYGASALDMPEAKAFITSWLQPEYVGVAFLVIGIVAFAARMRTLGGEA